MARKAGSHALTTGPKVRAMALKLFAEKGFSAVSMRQIAGALGMQAGALYTYTPDKQALLYDLLATHMTELLEAWSEVEQTGSPTERLERFTRFHIRYHLDRPNEVFIAYMELRNLNEENFAAIEARRREYEDILERILIDGLERDVFQIPDTKLATMALIAMLTGVTQWYRDDGRLSRDRVEKIYWNMVRRAVKG